MQSSHFTLDKSIIKLLHTKCLWQMRGKFVHKKKFICLTLNASCHNMTIANNVGFGTNVTTLTRTKLEVYYTRIKLEKLS
jgi:hypothetical protein